MRRRKRSVRVTAAVAMLAVASAAVVGSLLTQSPLWLAVGAVVALGLSWGALRLMWTEVLESRRENAADRAAAASAYRDLFAARAAEHADFATLMTERLAEAHLAQRQLEGLVVQHETRARRAQSKLDAEATAHTQTRSRVHALEMALAALQAGEDSVVELVAWDEKAQKKTRPSRPAKRA
jgi:hypothetical protein